MFVVPLLQYQDVDYISKVIKSEQENDSDMFDTISRVLSGPAELPLTDSELWTNQRRPHLELP